MTKQGLDSILQAIQRLDDDRELIALTRVSRDIDSIGVGDGKTKIDIYINPPTPQP